MALVTSERAFSSANITESPVELLDSSQGRTVILTEVAFKSLKSYPNKCYLHDSYVRVSPTAKLVRAQNHGV